jgi:hypothetical protein
MNKTINLHEQYSFPQSIPENMPLFLTKWCLIENKIGLWQLIKPGDIIVECGSWVGESSRHIAELVYDRDNPRKSGHIYCVDTWEGDSGHKKTYAHIIDKLYDLFIYNCWQYRSLITPIRAFSWDGMKIIADAGVVPNLVYIDASHDYIDVLKDLETAHNLWPNATLCGDDWVVCRGEVGRAVEDFAAQTNMQIYTSGNFWVLK